MGSEAEQPPSMSMPTPGRKIQMPTAHEMPSSPARSGMQTPPFYTTAAVPFRWEEEPGKPWPCTALAIVPKQPEDFAVKSLELPPRLLNEAIIAKMPSPTGVLLLEGPCEGRARIQASSFRMVGECYGSFRGLEGEDSGRGAGVCKRRRIKGTTWFGPWRGRRKLGINGEMEVLGSSSYVFPSVDREADWGWSFEGQEKGQERGRSLGRMTRTTSFPILSYTKSHFWTSIYEGLKGAIPWSRGLKKMGS